MLAGGIAGLALAANVTPTEQPHLSAAEIDALADQACRFVAEAFRVQVHAYGRSRDGAAFVRGVLAAWDATESDMRARHPQEADEILALADEHFGELLAEINDALSAASA